MTLTTRRPHQESALKISGKLIYYLNKIQGLTFGQQVNSNKMWESFLWTKVFFRIKRANKCRTRENCSFEALNNACGEDWTWESGYHVMACRYWGTGTVGKAFYIWEDGFADKIINSYVILVLSGWLFQKESYKNSFVFEIQINCDHGRKMFDCNFCG